MGMSSFSHGGPRFSSNADPLALRWVKLAQAVHPLVPRGSIHSPDRRTNVVGSSGETPEAGVSRSGTQAAALPQRAIAPSAPRLTGMERQVIRLVSLGCSLPEMAAILGRRLPTIDN